MNSWIKLGMRLLGKRNRALDEALAEYQSRKSRDSHPDGKFGGHKRFYPSQSEWQTCCNSISSPSLSFPYSLMIHCRTVEHVANLYGVPVKDLKRMIHPRREGGKHYYKSVAVTEDGRMVSIFDGETEYVLGVEMKEQARQNHKGGFYVYRSPLKAQAVEYPETSVAAGLPRRILEVWCEGQYCTYYNGKIAFSRIKPTAIVENGMVVA